MQLYVLGDLHLSFGTDKPMDIFSGWKDHAQRIENYWRSVVRDDDTVLLAGDSSWAMGIAQAIPDFKFIDSLPGKKIVMKGNHDYWWDTITKMDRCLQQNDIRSISFLHNNAYRVGGISVCGTRGWFYDAHGAHDEKVIAREASRFKMSCDAARSLGGEVVAFLHYPPVYAGRECPEMMDALLECGIKRCYYGHLHGKKNHSLATTGLYRGIDFSLISCDYTQFRVIPVSESNNLTENS
ncbi:MAG: metallophosphoesterase [Clostridia bacterium]|nr:metallophosphoesterase [Clostridia bacterium]